MTSSTHADGAGKGNRLMRDWTEWNYTEWAQALLRHYFQRSTELDPPVTSILATSNEIHRCAGMPAVAPDEVVTRFVEMTVRAAVSSGQSFWAHAFSRSSMTEPFHFAHLMVGCVVAAEASELSERSFIERLNRRTQPSSGDQGLERMPELWERLQSWLTDNGETYRPLVLPDTGGWVRIGHTVRLAFPSRADQRRLNACLDDAGLLIESPPLAPVLDGLIRRRQQFSDRFRDELDSFLALHQAGAASDVLYATPLWSAVASVTQDWMDLKEEGSIHARWTLIADDDGRNLDVAVATTEEWSSEDLATVPAVVSYGPWRFSLQRGSSIGAALDAVLHGDLRLQGLSDLVASGVVPLFENDEGALQAAGRADLSRAGLALVRRELRDAVVANFGDERTRTREFQTEGWEVCRFLQFRPLDDSALDASPLAKCWVFRAAPSPRGLRIVGGLRSGDSAWIGIQSALPVISASGSSSARLIVGGQVFELSGTAGEWALPRRQLRGQATISVDYTDGRRERSILFLSAPPRESYRTVRQPEGWAVEGLARAIALPDDVTLHAEEPCLVRGLERLTYLGLVVGEFLPGSDNAAWEVCEVGDRLSVKNLIPLDRINPSTRSDSARDRRAWRKLLNRAARTPGCDAAVAAAIRHVVQVVDSDLSLVDQPAPYRRHTMPNAAQHPRVDGVMGAVAALANSTAGIAPELLLRLFVDEFGVERTGAWAVKRAWQEAGMIRELVNVRWSNRRVVAVPPCLQIVRSSHGIRGILSGLALPTTVLAVRNEATKRGMSIESIGALSAFVPSTIMIRCHDVVALAGLASNQGLAIDYVADEPFTFIGGRDLTRNRPSGYAAGHVDAISDDHVRVQRWWLRGAPSYWSVDAVDRRTWTHFRDSAYFWAAAMAGAEPVRSSQGGVLVVERSYLPLQVARWLSAVGGVRAGPGGDGLYRYGTPTPDVEHLVLEGTRSIIRQGLSQMRETQGQEAHGHV